MRQKHLYGMSPAMVRHYNKLKAVQATKKRLAFIAESIRQANAVAEINRSMRNKR